MDVFRELHEEQVTAIYRARTVQRCVSCLKICCKCAIICLLCFICLTLNVERLRLGLMWNKHYLLDQILHLFFLFSSVGNTPDCKFSAVMPLWIRWTCQLFIRAEDLSQTGEQKYVYATICRLPGDMLQMCQRIVPTINIFIWFS